MEEPPRVQNTDDPWRLCPELNSIIPDDPKMSYDMRDVIHSVVDNGIFFEPHYYYAQNVIIGFARLNGRTIGIIASQPTILAGCLDIDASDKGNAFCAFL